MTAWQEPMEQSWIAQSAASGLSNIDAFLAQHMLHSRRLQIAQYLNGDAACPHLERVLDGGRQRRERRRGAQQEVRLQNRKHRGVVLAAPQDALQVGQQPQQRRRHAAGGADGGVPQPECLLHEALALGAAQVGGVLQQRVAAGGAVAGGTGSD